MEDEDRTAILARRASLVASALSALTAASAAAAQEPEVCLSIAPPEHEPPPPPPSPPPPPQVCLSIAPPQPSSTRVAVAFALGPGVVVETGQGSVFGGGGNRAAILVQMAPGIWFDGDVGAMLGFGDDGLGGVATTSTSILIHPEPAGVYGLGLGGGIGLGSVDAPGDEEVPDAFLAGFVLTPATLALGDARLEARLSTWFSFPVDDGSERYGVFVVPSLLATWVLPLVRDSGN